LEQQQQQANNQGCIHNQASPVNIVFPLSCIRKEENIFPLANYTNKQSSQLLMTFVKDLLQKLLQKKPMQLVPENFTIFGISCTGPHTVS